MNAARPPLDDCLRSFIRAIVQETLAECGQTAALKLYDVDHAAEMLAVPKRWLYERTSSGSIPCQRLGKYIRFTDADLRAIVAERKGAE